MSDETIALRLTHAEAAEVRRALLATPEPWTNTLDRATKALDPQVLQSDAMRQYVGAMRGDAS
jgi:hypothetical protein